MPAVPDDMEQFNRTKKPRNIQFGPPDCPHPQNKQECGFGLAGGGYGGYMYCTVCYRIYDKTEAMED